jgi:uncharacterized protein (TIGR03067 family)
MAEAKKIKCPRCGFVQPPARVCPKCRVIIPKYIEHLKKKRAAQAQGPQKPQPEAKPQPPQEKAQPPQAEPTTPWSKKPQKKGSPPPEPTKAQPHPLQKIDLKLPPPPPPTIETFSGIGTLFSRSWEIYKSRAGALIALYVLSFIFMALPLGIFAGGGFLLSMKSPESAGLILSIGGALGGLIGSIAMSGGLAALIYAVVDESLGIRDALGKGFTRLWSFMWLWSLLVFIVTGGFLLFIVPGIIFAVWFILAQFVLAEEDDRGMNALFKSMEYVSTYWMDVFLRLFVIWLVFTLIGIVPIIGAILSFLLVPFAMIYTYLIYKDLKAIKGITIYSTSAGRKFKWLFAGTLGYVVVPVAVVAILIALTPVSLPFLLNNSMALLKGGGMEFTVPQEIMPQEAGIPPEPAPQEQEVAKAPAEPPDREKLQGRWKGKQMGGDYGWAMDIGKDTLALRGPDGNEVYSGAIIVNESTDPRQLDIIISKASISQYVGKTAYSIYMIEGNRLTLCGSEPGEPLRPASFTPDKLSVCFEMSRG